eukprot:3644773-Rhodomonas_salina.1
MPKSASWLLASAYSFLTVLVAEQKWIVGKQYPVIAGELFYMSIRNEEKLRELQDWQVGAASGRDGRGGEGK